MKWTRKDFLLRIPLSSAALVLVVAGVVVMAGAAASGDAGGVILGLLIVVAGGCLGGAVVSHLLGASFTGFLLGKRETPEKRPLYGVAETHEQRGRYEEAYEAWVNMLLEFPGDVKAYRRLLDLCQNRLHDIERAEQVVGMAIRDETLDVGSLTRLKERLAVIRSRRDQNDAFEDDEDFIN